MNYHFYTDKANLPNIWVQECNHCRNYCCRVDSTESVLLFSRYLNHLHSSCNSAVIFAIIAMNLVFDDVGTSWRISHKVGVRSEAVSDSKWLLSHRRYYEEHQGQLSKMWGGHQLKTLMAQGWGRIASLENVSSFIHRLNQVRFIQSPCTWWSSAVSWIIPVSIAPYTMHQFWHFHLVENQHWDKKFLMAMTELLYFKSAYWISVVATLAINLYKNLWKVWGKCWC